MIFLKLLWMGATALVGGEFLKFFKDTAEGAARDEPAPDGAVPPDERETNVALAPASQPSDEQQITDNDRAIALTGGALALAAGGAFFNPWLRLLSWPLLVAALYPAVRHEVRQFRSGRPARYQVLELVQAVSELAMGYIGLTAGGWLVYTSGQHLLLSTRREVKRQLASALHEVPESVWLVRDGVEVQIPLERVVAGDLIAVRAGEPIPVDGHIVEGAIGVDQRALTGESRLKELSVGDPVRAATLVLSGHAIVCTECTGGETVAARVEALIAGSTSYEQQLQARVSRITDRSVRPTLLIAGYGYWTRGPMGLLGGFWTNALDIAWLSSPLAMRMTCQAAATVGLFVKDGRSLELIQSVDTVVFDKTGTLTLDQFDVGAVHRFDWTVSEIEALRLAAALEGRQSHPIARAIVAAAQRDPRALPEVEACIHEIGYGVRGVIAGRSIALGSRRMMASEAVVMPQGPELEAITVAAERAGHSLIFLAIDRVLVCAIELAPQIRPEAFALVQQLRSLGLTIMMITGDDDGPAQALAAHVGIPHVFSRTLPADKGLIIERLQAQGRRVCFVGDGINDAIALKRATVSVSIQGASAVAVESAQILVRHDALDRLPLLFEIGRRYLRDQRAIEAASKISTAINVTGFLLAGFGLPLVVGIYLTGFGVSLAVASAPRFRRYLPEGEPPMLQPTEDGDTTPR
jgi:Cu2+-exporting ATPase